MKVPRPPYTIQREPGRTTLMIVMNNRETGEAVPVLGGFTDELAAGYCAAQLLVAMIRNAKSPEAQLTDALQALKKAES